MSENDQAKSTRVQLQVATTHSPREWESFEYQAAAKAYLCHRADIAAASYGIETPRAWPIEVTREVEPSVVPEIPDRITHIRTSIRFQIDVYTGPALNRLQERDREHPSAAPGASGTTSLD